MRAGLAGWRESSDRGKEADHERYVLPFAAYPRTFPALGADLLFRIREAQPEARALSGCHGITGDDIG